MKPSLRYYILVVLGPISLTVSLSVSSAWGRLPNTAYVDITAMLERGQESSAELTSYYFLRNYPAAAKSVEVKFILADIYERQARLDEMILWLKDLEKDPQLPKSEQPRLAYLLLSAHSKKGDQSAAQIQRSLLLRKFPQSQWTQKVMAK